MFPLYHSPTLWPLNMYLPGYWGDGYTGSRDYGLPVFITWPHCVTKRWRDCGAVVTWLLTWWCDVWWYTWVWTFCFHHVTALRHWAAAGLCRSCDVVAAVVKWRIGMSRGDTALYRWFGCMRISSFLTPNMRRIGGEWPRRDDNNLQLF